MDKHISWEIVPEIRLIVSRRVKLGPGTSNLWLQHKVRGPYWRIYWNDTPGAFVECDGREEELTPKRVVALSPDAVYSTRAKKMVRHFYTHCFVEMPFSEIKDKMFITENENLVAQASALAKVINNEQTRWRTMMELMVFLNSVLLTIPKKSVPMRPTYSSKVSRAVEIIKSSKRVSNDVLAKKVGMSRNGFLFLFKKETKMSPQVYSRKLRINEACVMLQHSEKTIEEIASETGFCDRYHFSRIFHQVIGDTPKQFRLRKLVSTNDRSWN